MKGKTCIIYILIIIMLLSGCITNQQDNQQGNNQEYTGGRQHQEQNYETGYEIPLYPDAEEITHMPDDELWTSFNIGSSLNRKLYLSADEPQEIYSWYNTLENESIVEKNSVRNSQTNEIDFYYLKFRNDSKGVFVVIMKGDEHMPGDVKSLFAIAEG
ncbi:MAG: hypothetical protein FE039_02725, partial [Thermoplasmata archaeon]